LPKSIKQTDLFRPTSKKIKKEIIRAENILNIKKLKTFFPKNFPNKQEIARFKNGKNMGNRYILIF
jgi:hypothetical protein